MRTDFFTRKHKSLRARLFETSDLLGRADWAEDDDVKRVQVALAALDADMSAHGKHEDAYIMPLLAQGAPDLLAAIEEEHEADVARRAALLRLAQEAAAAPVEQRVAAGLGVYRAFQRYLSGYLLHLDAEETQVMPMLWATLDEPTLAATLARFVAEVASKQAPEETAHMLAHMTPPERAQMLAGIRARAPPAAVESLRALLDPQLTPGERARLARDLT